MMGLRTTDPDILDDDYDALFEAYGIVFSDERPTVPITVGKDDKPVSGGKPHSTTDGHPDSNLLQAS